MSASKPALDVPVSAETMPGKPYWLAFMSIALPIVLVLVYFLVSSYQQAQRAVEVAMHNMAATVAVSIDASLRRVESDLSQLAVILPMPALQQANVPRYAEAMRADLEQRIAYFDELSSYRIFDADGNSLYNSGKQVPTYSVADRSYFKAAKAAPQQSLHYSEALTGKQTFEPVVVVAKAIVDPQGRFLGVVIGGMKMNYYSDFFANLDLGKSGAIALRRQTDGALLARWPELREGLNKPLSAEHPMQKMVASGRATGTLSMVAQTDHQERLYVYQRLENYPFVVFVGRAVAEYLAQWRASAIMTSAFMLLVLLGLAYVLRREWQVRCHDQRVQHDLAAARDAAEAASRAKSTFLANMSHELRTPMNGIIGLTELAMRRTDDAYLRQQLGKIDQASHHLLAVVNNILDISKIEADHLVLERTDFRLGEVLEHLVGMVGERVAAKGLRLLIDLPAGFPAMSLRGDPLRLGQILLNLVGNALKFTEQGAITLRAREVETRDQRVLLRWEIEDTGVGIAAADQPRLFVAFEQADGSLTRKYGGTGLGLAISKRLANMMGGEIGITSEPGKGSTFWFTTWFDKAEQIPAVPPTPTFSMRSAEERLLDDYRGTRVLLAEDEPISQEVSRGLLEDAGLQVDLAADGAEALALARANAYALILMDMQMPNLNGIDATRQIRSESLNRTTPILAMTANAFEEDRQACLAAGMNDHLAKPIDPENLYETLLRWMPEQSA